MTTTEMPGTGWPTTPKPAMTPCPVTWCQEPQPHNWETNGWDSWQRVHVRNLDAEGYFLLKYYESAVRSEGPRAVNDDYDMTRIDLDEHYDFRQAEAIDTAARLHQAMSEAVAVATSSPGCDEDTPAIRLVLAERAVLDAVADWVDGDGRGIAVENAYAALAAARDEVTR